MGNPEMIQADTVQFHYRAPNSAPSELPALPSPAVRHKMAPHSGPDHVQHDDSSHSPSLDPSDDEPEADPEDEEMGNKRPPPRKTEERG
jgi:hypothetical protein